MVLFGFLVPLVFLVILVGIGFGVRRLFSGPLSGSPSDSDVRSSIEAGPVIVYAVSFVGLMAFLYAVAGLLSLLLAETVFRAQHVLSASDARQQASYLLAALIVSTPLWLGFWRLEARRIARSPSERQAPERRVYLALAFAVTSVVALFALHTVLRVVLSIPTSHDSNSLLRDGVEAGVRLLVYGGAWAAYARLAFRERAGSERDPARDLALAILSAFSLAFLVIGCVDGIGALVNEILGARQTVIIGGAPQSLGALWAGIAAWLIAGGAVWAAVSWYDGSYPGVRSFRVAYLFVVLAVSVPVTLLSSSDLLYEVLRRALGYHTLNNWGFLHDVLPPLLVGGVVWAYHWLALRRQTAIESLPGRVPFPSRPYLAALSFAGLAMTATAAVSLLWLILDSALRAHSTLSGSQAWHDRLSFGLAVILIGAVVWIGPWAILQRASGDAVERAATARRWLLGAVVLIATLIGIGFAIALIWLVLRTLLGGPHDVATADDMLRYLSATIVAVALIAYHGLILRGDLRVRRGRPERLQIAALVGPGGETTLRELSRLLGRRVDVAGYLTESADEGVDAAALASRIESLEGYADRVLVVIGASQRVPGSADPTRGSGTLYAYDRKRRSFQGDPAEGAAPTSAAQPAQG